MNYHFDIMERKYIYEMYEDIIIEEIWEIVY